MSISDKNDRLTVIIPKEMKEKLKIIAGYHNRSLSNYVVSVLDSQIDKELDKLEMYGSYKVAEEIKKYSRD